MRFSLPTAASLAAVFLSSPLPVSAQVEVVESSPTIRAIGQPRTTTSPTTATPGTAADNIHSEV